MCTDIKKQNLRFYLLFSVVCFVAFFFIQLLLSRCTFLILMIGLILDIGDMHFQI